MFIRSSEPKPERRGPTKRNITFGVEAWTLEELDKLFFRRPRGYRSDWLRAAVTEKLERGRK